MARLAQTLVVEPEREPRLLTCSPCCHLFPQVTETLEKLPRFPSKAYSAAFLGEGRSLVSQAHRDTSITIPLCVIISVHVLNDKSGCVIRKPLTQIQAIYRQVMIDIYTGVGSTQESSR